MSPVVVYTHCPCDILWIPPPSLPVRSPPHPRRSQHWLTVYTVSLSCLCLRCNSHVLFSENITFPKVNFYFVQITDWKAYTLCFRTSSRY